VNGTPPLKSNRNAGKKLLLSVFAAVLFIVRFLRTAKSDEYLAYIGAYEGGMQHQELALDV